MKLLVIGGTMFLGRHIVDAALADGHSVTLANRGKTNADLYPSVEKLVVDRDGDISALTTGEWDAVIDTCGYVPGHVRPIAELLSDRVGHYTFVSTVSVYGEFPGPGLNEDEAPLASTEGIDPTALTNEAYGPLKILCENEVVDVYGDCACIVRPGLIVGPWDPSDRFTYWPRRFDLGGEAIVPDWKEMAVQVADVRDLAEWMVRLAANKTPGVFNGCGPQAPWTLSQLVDACITAAGDNAATPVWVDEEFLLEHEVAPWGELPLWLPEVTGMANMLAVDVSRAVAAGLTFRTLDTVVADTLAWDRDTQRGRDLRGPLTAEKEADVLMKWKSR